MNRAFARTASVALTGLALGLCASGCFNPFAPRVAPASSLGLRGVSDVAPVPNTPTELMKLFAWCWNHRAYDEYTEIFTKDFQFQFGLADSAGNFYRDHGLYRDEELDTARHLFVEGTATEPPARNINLTLGSFIPYPDSRRGKEYPWHQEIRTSVTLTIDTGDQQYNITGAARFFVVRGDSALIPDELRERGFGPDRNRWYIERWEDETAGAEGGASAAGPASPPTLARVGAAITPGAAPAGASAATLATPREVTWGFVKRVYLRP